ADGAHPYTRVGRYLESAVRNAASGDTRAAQTCLQRALAIVDRHGFRRALVDSRLPVREILTDYVGDDRPFRMVATQLLERMVADAGSGPSRYVETLTERELMVLGFLPTMMSNSEIAAEMFFSVNTVKTHLKSIYRKLEVSRRRDAVVRARELNLI
ncbi:MAG TPA: helix-turn-helix transcriptional regulator, partial [Acidimicrobiia bacterium]|nr:helix-turn-helix transcriptional regulator [Acidimicrobiia bacterium]